MFSERDWHPQAVETHWATFEKSHADGLPSRGVQVWTFCIISLCAAFQTINGFFLASSSMFILCPLLSLQWEQMQQMEEEEAGALRGICTEVYWCRLQSRCQTVKHWSLTLKFFSSMQENRILVQERIWRRGLIAFILSSERFISSHSCWIALLLQVPVDCCLSGFLQPCTHR